jgi:hypothetical protein
MGYWRPTASTGGQGKWLDGMSVVEIVGVLAAVVIPVVGIVIAWMQYRVMKREREQPARPSWARRTLSVFVRSLQSMLPARFRSRTANIAAVDEDGSPEGAGESARLLDDEPRNCEDIADGRAFLIGAEDDEVRPEAAARA